jgi:acetolactate synthase-1/2/3 large subunit
LDIRQTGFDTKVFASNAKLLRVEVDENELTNKIKKDEEVLLIDLKKLLPELDKTPKCELPDYSPWIGVCDEIQIKLCKERNTPNRYIEELNEFIPEDAMITTDVGQNQIWVAQSFAARGQRVLFSGGHGAMGYSLPAAIGAFFGSRKVIIAFTGDGGLQMNIQELQFLAREQIPVKIILLNNASLGMIRHFQEMYFDKNYAQTQRTSGYTVPDFAAVAKAYGIPACKISDPKDIGSVIPYIQSTGPALIEIVLPDETYAFPKSSIGKEIHDQEPLIDRSLFNYLSAL